MLDIPGLHNPACDRSRDYIRTRSALLDGIQPR